MDYKFVWHFEEINCFTRRGHLWDIAEYLGTETLSYFTDELYNHTALVFFNPQQMTMEQAQQIFKPFHHLGGERQDEVNTGESEITLDIEDGDTVTIYYSENIHKKVNGQWVNSEEDFDREDGDDYGRTNNSHEEEWNWMDVDSIFGYNFTNNQYAGGTLTVPRGTPWMPLKPKSV